MTSRGRTTLFLFLGTLLSALSLGNPLFFLFALLLGLMLTVSLISLIMSKALTDFRFFIPGHTLERGKEQQAELVINCKSPLPLMGMRIRLTGTAGQAEYFSALRFGQQRLAFRVPFPHVGVFALGVDSLALYDCFGFFVMPLQMKNSKAHITVLPLSYALPPITLSQTGADEGAGRQSGEDITSPEDIRAYRQGDPIKRIHWKLSQRARELIVRKFEVPIPPDTLIMMDGFGADEQTALTEDRLRLRDALTETTLSCATEQLKLMQPIRIPLYGTEVTEFQKTQPGHMDLLRIELAKQVSRGLEPLEKTLMLETRRLRRTGAVLIVSTRLTWQIVESIKNIRSFGPSVRLYLVAHDTPDRDMEPLIASLQQQLIEVCYVKPA